jgi:serine/threonine protein kinase
MHNDETSIIGIDTDELHPGNLPVGAVLVGRYKVQGVLGRGGMGVVYRVHDLRDGAMYALKVLLLDSSDHLMLERMASEAVILAFLRHPNIVPVHDMGTDPNTHIHYAVMEMAPHGSLGDLIDAHGPLTADQTASVGVQLCCALDVLHQRGILHRDIKPTNLLRAGNGRVLLTDFGISKIPDASGEATDTDQVMGSFLYMAPEQRLGMDAVIVESDLYAVGTTLFKLVTNRTPMDIFALPIDHERWQSVPEALRPILRWATQFDPSARPSSARDLGRALAELAPPELFEEQPHLRAWLDD